jgi:hypothetical protein
MIVISTRDFRANQTKFLEKLTGRLTLNAGLKYRRG